ncbi:MAG: hypothetical protein WBA74_17910 [Cyclobacteriaceae bacterium]
MQISFAQDLFNFGNSLRYAKYLYANGDYKEAIPELNRCIFLAADKSKNEVLDLLLVSYRRTNQYHEMLHASESLYPSGDFPDPVLKELHYSFILSNKLALGDQLLQTRPFEERYNQIRFEVAYDVFSNQYDNGLKKISSFTPQTPEGTQFNTRATIMLREAAALKYKSPAKAGLLSMIIPGAGKFYANRKKDAVFSFILTVVAAYQSYRAFNKNGIDSVFGWVYGGLAGGFYVGNIYGSVQAAKRTNELANERYHDQMRTIIGL